MRHSIFSSLQRAVFIPGPPAQFFPGVIAKLQVVSPADPGMQETLVLDEFLLRTLDLRLISLSNVEDDADELLLNLLLDDLLCVVLQGDDDGSPLADVFELSTLQQLADL